MVVRMRHTRGKTRMRRSHHAIKPAQISRCSHCAKAVLPHVVCQNCGWYKGRQVVDVLAKLGKKERKKKEKELADKTKDEGRTTRATSASIRP